MNLNKNSWRWSLKDYPPSNNYTVFSCFACGGGSTMGYKLAGYNVIGCNDIDSKMINIYRMNHDKNYDKLIYNEDIRTFYLRTNLPKELYNLDILDGSPPCTTFSMAGDREESWGKKKKFNEGQSEQTLDDLCFKYIELVNKLQPKIFVMENVEGMIIGNAKKYISTIYQMCKESGYETLGIILNSSKMFVPQSRERLFILGINSKYIDLFKGNTYNIFTKTPYIDLIFNNEQITLKDIFTYSVIKRNTQNYSQTRFGDVICSLDKPMPTITTINRYWLNENELICNNDIISAQTFPYDYDFNGNNIQYVCGMSVPPIMMASVAERIKKYWLDIIYNNIEQNK